MHLVPIRFRPWVAIRDTALSGFLLESSPASRMRRRFPFLPQGGRGQGMEGLIELGSDYFELSFALLLV